MRPTIPATPEDPHAGSGPVEDRVRELERALEDERASTRALRKRLAETPAPPAPGAMAATRDDETLRYLASATVAAQADGDPIALVAGACRRWVSSKHGFDGAVFGLEPAAWSEEGRAVRVDSFDGADERAWGLELVERDGGFRYRSWIVRVGAFSRASDPMTAHVAVSLYTRISADYIGDVRDPDPSVPNIVGELAGMEGAQVSFGGCPASAGARELATASEVDSLLLAQIANPGREVPIVVVSAGGSGVWPVDPDRLAEAIRGMAVTIAVDRRREGVDSALRGAFERGGQPSAYRVEPYAIVRYYPGADPEADPDGRYRSYLSGRYMYVRCHGNQTVIIRRIREALLRRAAPPRVGGPEDVAALATRSRSEQLARDIKSLKTELAARSERTSAADARGGEQEGSLEGLKRDLKDQRELIDMYEQENDELRAQERDASERAARAESKASALQQRLDERGEATELEDVTDALSRIPGTLPELLTLARVLWPDRVVVLDDAMKSAEEFANGDLDEEWDIIRCAATTLYDAAFIEDAPDIVAYVRNVSGRDLAMTETKETSRNPGLRRLRRRVYNGREIDITPHLKGRQPKVDPFRLHFCIDREGRRIVIGHAGAHLETVRTSKVS